MVSYRFKLCSDKICVENWYEERLALEQAYRQNPEKRVIREYEPSINCLTSTGLPKPLARINRVPKHDTTKLIPSDGFNEMKSTNKTDLQNPTVHKI